MIPHLNWSYALLNCGYPEGTTNFQQVATNFLKILLIVENNRGKMCVQEVSALTLSTQG